MSLNFAYRILWGDNYIAFRGSVLTFCNLARNSHFNFLGTVWICPPFSIFHYPRVVQSSKINEIIQWQDVEYSSSVLEEDEDLFDVGGVQWNFSSRCAEYLTSAVFVSDVSLHPWLCAMFCVINDNLSLFNGTLQIYRVICARENGCEPEVRTMESVM